MNIQSIYKCNILQEGESLPTQEDSINSSDEFESQDQPDIKELTKEIDQYVGKRLRLRRNILRLSQEQLAKKLDLTFQQVQKYEKGANRVGAGRLYIIASVLGVDCNYFFDGFVSSALPNQGFAENTSNDDDFSFVDTDVLNPEIIKIIAAMRDIQDKEVRQDFANLIMSMAKSLKKKNNIEF